jgi:hypothetical protein
MSDGNVGLIGRLARLRRSGSLALVLAVAPFMTGCFGYFPLTRAVYKANNSVESGFLRNLLFWLFAILPVYGGAMLIDAIALNLLEFWLPGNRRDEVTLTEDGRSIAFRPSEDGKEAWLTVSEGDRLVAEVRFVRVSDELCEVRDADGRLLGTAQRTASGGMDLSDADGRVLRTVAALDLAMYGAK